MLKELKELWRFRELLIVMVQRELRVRYKNSLLGILWSFLNPLLYTFVFWLVFSQILGVGQGNYTAYLLAAYIPFSFVQTTVLDASQSVLGAMPVIKKVYFPRELLPLATILANAVHMLLGFGVFFSYLAVVWITHPGQSPFQWGTVFLPFLILVTIALATGLALLASALNTFYEDVKYLVTVGFNLLMYLSPVVYTSEYVVYHPRNIASGGLIYKLYHLNPLATLCTSYRQTLLAPQGMARDGRAVPGVPLDPKYLLITTVFSFGVLIYGYHVFNKAKWRFMERP